LKDWDGSKVSENVLLDLPSWELKYPTYEKGTSSSQVPLKGDMVVIWRVWVLIFKLLKGALFKIM